MIAVSLEEESLFDDESVNCGVVPAMKIEAAAMAAAADVANLHLTAEICFFQNSSEEVDLNLMAEKNHRRRLNLTVEAEATANHPSPAAEKAMNYPPVVAVVVIVNCRLMVVVVVRMRMNPAAEVMAAKKKKNLVMAVKMKKNPVMAAKMKKNPVMAAKMKKNPVMAEMKRKTAVVENRSLTLAFPPAVATIFDNNFCDQNTKNLCPYCSPKQATGSRMRKKGDEEEGRIFPFFFLNNYFLLFRNFHLKFDMMWQIKLVMWRLNSKCQKTPKN
ncbi:hypothetical protein CDL12_21483 [Handroanthus impetiginosus]|uniref:Uncharacterized protein n=1 Tax=Handroanthus impetiginosus TaxID=429701 RepID=A0A2G9GKY5_9LAMI|nr:hypothetical protein CDL12_21483 [Handroanthus impetiginosus]